MEMHLDQNIYAMEQRFQKDLIILMQSLITFVQRNMTLNGFHFGITDTIENVTKTCKKVNVDLKAAILKRLRISTRSWEQKFQHNTEGTTLGKSSFWNCC